MVDLRGNLDHQGSPRFGALFSTQQGCDEGEKLVVSDGLVARHVGRNVNDGQNRNGTLVLLKPERQPW